MMHDINNDSVATVGKLASSLEMHLRCLCQPATVKSATIIYVDNLAAIMMANAGKSTERSRHIDVQ
jgi:hypothetical protein